MIVADTNIIVYRCFPGEWSAAALDLGRRDPEWHAPVLWQSEFRNVLAGKIRRGLPWASAGEVMASASGYIGDREHAVDSRPVLRLIAETQCSAYDLEFVVLAQQLGAPLYTMDRQLLARFPGLARPLIPS